MIRVGVRDRDMAKINAQELVNGGHITKSKHGRLLSRLILTFMSLTPILPVNNH